MDDREVVAAIAAGDQAGLAAAYDNHAAALYGYCQWMLTDRVRAAEALRDTFVVASATIGDLAEDTKLRPWLYALARKQCQRRRFTKPSADDGEAEAIPPVAAAGPPVDMTMPIRVVPAETDATVQFRAIRPPADATSAPPDATVVFPAIRPPADVPAPPDATVQFRAIRPPADVPAAPADATMPIILASQPGDATQPISAFRRSAPAAGPAPAGPVRSRETDLSALVRGVLAELKPSDREVVELVLSHNLYDDDLAIALDVSWSRAHVRMARARRLLEHALSAPLIAHIGREDCPELGTLLAGWDGQLTEQARALVTRHIETCETCAARKSGALRSAVVSGLPPPAELPPELRAQVFAMCFSNTRDAAGYRRRAVRRAESIWPARFSLATKNTNRARVGTRRRPATATVAIVIWIVAVWVVLITLLVFTGPHSSRALTGQSGTDRPGSKPSARNPAGAALATTAPASASASASPSHRPSPTRVPPSSVPSATGIAPASSPSSSAQPSGSPSPSKSPSPSPSKSSSPSPSKSASPSPSASRSASPSP